MIIAIDFDETLFPTLEKVIIIYNHRHNTNLSLEQITVYNLYESLDTSVADEILNIFLEKEVYDGLHPYEGAVKAVEKMVKQGHDIYIATATNAKNLEWKEKLLQVYFPFIPKNNIIRIHQKSLLKVDVIIDDNMKHLTESFADRICFDQLWNRSSSKDYSHGIYRVNNWSEVPNIINNIEREMKKWEKM